MHRSVVASITLCALATGSANIARADKDPVIEMERFLENRYAEDALVDVVAGSMGTRFDCVDRSRQPGLRRVDGTFAPLAAPPRPVERDRPSRLAQGEAPAELETVSCPAGSVPVPHVDLDTLRRFGSLDRFFAKHPGGTAAARGVMARPGSTALHQYAGVSQSGANWGGDAAFNLWNPFTERDNEFSLSQIGATRGTGNNQQTLEAGWQEFGDIYGDREPHLFIYSTQDGYVSTGCYNNSCGDFVQVSASIVPAAAFTVHSTDGGSQFVIQLRWQRDDPTDNWWLMYGTTWVGYYPGTLFDSAGVRNEASDVLWFGEIINDDPAGHTNTDMGSGGFPGGGFGHTAFTRTLRTISTSNTWQTASSAVEFRTDSDCYDVDLAFSVGLWANHYYFGGEGQGPNCE